MRLHDFSDYRTPYIKFAGDTKCFLLISTTVPCRKISLLYLPGPEIPTWTLTSRNLFTCHSNASWTPHILRISDRYIPHSDLHKDLGLILSKDYAKINTIKPLLHVLTKCWANNLHYSLFSFNFHSGKTICITGPITISLLHSNNYGILI